MSWTAGSEVFCVAISWRTGFQALIRESDLEGADSNCYYTESHFTTMSAQEV